MPLSRYASQCRVLIEELRQSLSAEQIECLRQDLATIGVDEWPRWVLRNHAHVSMYAAATPAERLKKKAWADPETQRLLTLAAIWHLTYAHILLTKFVSHGIEPGLSYRSLGSAAGDVARSIQLADYPKWPFGGIDPFLS